MLSCSVTDSVLLLTDALMAFSLAHVGCAVEECQSLFDSSGNGGISGIDGISEPELISGMGGGTGTDRSIDRIAIGDSVVA